MTAETAALCRVMDCEREGSLRMIVKPNAVLSGSSLKVAAVGIIICDEHWKQIQQAKDDRS